jgi:hypothetical protein
LTPDLDSRSVEIAPWMFDAATCSVMPLATTPTVRVEALHELQMLLAAVGDETSGVSRQAKHLEACASGGADARDDQAVTGRGNRWTQERVTALRSHHGARYIPEQRAEQQWLNLTEAARMLGVSARTAHRGRTR